MTAADELHELLNDLTIPLSYGGVIGYPLSDRLKGVIAQLDDTKIEKDGQFGPLTVSRFWNQVIGVDATEARRLRPGVVAAIVGTRDEPVYGRAGDYDLTTGLNYIALGAMIGDQLAAFRLLGLGDVLRLWDVVAPDTLLGYALNDPVGQDMAGKGFIMASGWHPDGLTTPRRKPKTPPTPTRTRPAEEPGEEYHPTPASD